MVEKTIVSIISAAIAVIFVVVTKPWEARLPRTHTPTDHQPTVTAPLQQPKD